jgi:competence protein ComFC
MDIFADLLSSRCFLCKGKGKFICPKCLSKFEPSIQKCIVCENFSENGVTHPLCKITNPNSPDVYISLFEYNFIAAKVLKMSKYPPYYFYLLRFLILNYYPKLDSFSFFACPIPISANKMYEREFNQSEIISNALFDTTGILEISILNRNRDSVPLYLLDKIQRKRELKNIFKINSLKFFADVFGYKNVIIVDDLKTTGETIFQAVKTLKKHGFNNISAFSLFTT